MAEGKSKAPKKAESTIVHPNERYLFWYEKMLLMRRFEEKAGQLYGQQKIKGFCHLYIGQEAVAAGTYTALTPNDHWITAYRDHGIPLVLGTSANAIMAELYGKETGTTRGKGGSMHIFDKERNFAGGHGIVGGQIPLGAGMAFAEKYKKTGSVVVTLMGDGAVRQGSFHETLNMAMMWKLPVIFGIENNGYAMGTSVQRTSNVTELYQLAESYDMPSEAVDGMDVETVHEALSRIGEHVRSGKGPYLVEYRTYRYKGHSMSDPAKYRTKEELEAYKQKDPLAKIKHKLLELGIASEDQLSAIDDKIKEEVAESVRFAEESPWPAAHQAYEDVYVEPNYPFIQE